MVKINNNDLIDYVDGTLDVARLAMVEAHLRTNAEDAEMVATMKLAQEALGEWDEVEPVKVSDDFWMKVRDQLPAQPPRSWWRRAMAQANARLWPAHSQLRLSVGVAAIAAFIFLAASFFAPQRDVHPTIAMPKLTLDEKAFIEQSLDRHSAYVSSQPLSGPSLIVPGDARSAEHGGDDGGGHDDTPQ